MNISRLVPFVLLGLSLGGAVPGVQAQVASGSSAEALRRALAADPVTAPYEFSTRQDRGRVVLSGRVGTKTVYDRAVRIAIATGIPFTERLVIDTAEVTRELGTASSMPAARAVPLTNGPPYVYPQPLFGYYDDPFFGFEPPLLSFPPWWQPRTDGATVAAPPGRPAPGQAEQTVELTVDPLGFGILRGTVATEAERDGIGAKASKLPGVRGIINQIQVAGESEAPAARPPLPGEIEAGPAPAPPEPELDDQPPPPPRPYDPKLDAPGAAVPGGLAARVNAAIAAVPGSDGTDVKAEAAGSTITLTGRAGTAREALHAFRAAQQTTGVARIIDRIKFPLPTSAATNTLLDGVAAEDLGPYLTYHLGRQLGDGAEVSRVEVQGRALEVSILVGRLADRARVEAILRSSPLLRGFQVRPDVRVR
jgi:osmotically-inducible protein OsmY